MNMKNSLFVLLAFVAVIGIASAQAEWQLWGALSSIKYLFCTILPIVMMVAFMMAALVYAAGQMVSADQRARFHGWATNHTFRFSVENKLFKCLDATHPQG